MSRVLIINTPGLFNRGGMAVVMGSLQGLRDALPDARITVLCHHSTEDWDTIREICGRHNVEVKKHPWFKEHDSRTLALVHSCVPAGLFFSKCILGRLSGKLGVRPRGTFQESDVILDLNIDALHDNYGIFFPLWALSNLLAGTIVGRPVVVWSAGIGQFDKRLTKSLARFVLNRVDVIMAREEVTKDYVGKLGVHKPKVYLTADHAFVMSPAPAGRVAEILEKEGIAKAGRPLVGIAVSNLIHRYAFPDIADRQLKHRKYAEVMAKAADYLVDKMNAEVLLISHSIVLTEDDRTISGEVRQQVKRKDKVRVLAGDYMSDELKGIIGTCDMFIGSRMHSTIASTSMGVPTIAIVYGQKSYGIMGGMMGQSSYIIGIAKVSPDELETELSSKIDSAWANREAIHQDLVMRGQAARERAMLNGSLVRAFLESGAWPR
jgi:colanic acid/amylovoran biosynthesis protein